MFVLNLAIVLPVTMIILALQGVSLGMVAFSVLSFLTPMVLRRQDKLQQFLTIRGVTVCMRIVGFGA